MEDRTFVCGARTVDAGPTSNWAAPHFSHWLRLGRILPSPPPIFGVNWFRTDKKGYFLWPGYGENRRISKCIIDRANGCAAVIESPLAWKPRHEDLDWRGLEGFPPGRFQELLAVDRDARANGFISHEDLLTGLYDRLPKKLIFIRELILSASGAPRSAGSPAFGSGRSNGGLGGSAAGCPCPTLIAPGGAAPER